MSRTTFGVVSTPTSVEIDFFEEGEGTTCYKKRKIQKVLCMKIDVLEKFFY